MPAERSYVSHLMSSYRRGLRRPLAGRHIHKIASRHVQLPSGARTDRSAAAKRSEALDLEESYSSMQRADGETSRKVSPRLPYREVYVRGAWRVGPAEIANALSRRQKPARWRRGLDVGRSNRSARAPTRRHGREAAPGPVLLGWLGPRPAPVRQPSARPGSPGQAEPQPVRSGAASNKKRTRAEPTDHHAHRATSQATAS